MTLITTHDEIMTLLQKATPMQRSLQKSAKRNIANHKNEISLITRTKLSLITLQHKLLITIIGAFKIIRTNENSAPIHFPSLVSGRPRAQLHQRNKRNSPKKNRSIVNNKKKRVKKKKRELQKTEKKF